ncbi:1080_t:CDS:2, partial [Dentiscutata erythropus]
ETLQSNFEEDPIDLSLNDNLVEVFALAIEDILEPIPTNSSVVQIVKETYNIAPLQTLNRKDKKRGYFRDYKDPNMQCWCDENLYSPKEVAKSYWPTPYKDDEFDEEFNPHLYGTYLLSDYDPDKNIKLVFPEQESDQAENRDRVELATIPW